ncbi:MAG: hypothetical protein JNL28_15930 [Planctomycetes bacterium]|nr:hypothetical protein [Planctomycetota bacterium]
MSQAEHQPTARRATPAVDRLLARLSARITSNVFLHGLATALTFGALWLLAAFLLDWALHLPGPIRIFHLGLLTAIPAFFLWRDLVRPLSKRPDRAGLAVIVERAHPDLHQVLVSAVQISADDRGAGDAELVSAVVAEAEQRAPQIDLDRVLDPSGPRRRAWIALATCASVVLLFVLRWDMASVFLARMAGANTPWPQRTHLAIEVPTAARLFVDSEPAPDADVHQDEVTHKVARGSDVPILVRADGEVPEEVVLHFTSGHRVVLAAGGGAEFRTLLPAVQEDLSFYATGGDDQDELPLVHLRVLQPPDVSGLAVEITPPAYSGLAATVNFDRDVEVLSGSKVVVHVLTDPPSATGKVRLVPEDRLLELETLPFPLSADEAAANKTARTGLAFAILPTKSLRYRFELHDSTGLSNPNPGLFGITVVEDRAPEVELLSPGRGDFDTVAGGVLPLRARAEDDFGIQSVSYSVEITGLTEGAPPLVTPLAFNAIPVEARGDEPAVAGAASGVRTRSARAAVLARARLEIATLAGAEPATEGRQFQLQVLATDISAPTAKVGRSSPLRVRVVSTDEFMRRLQDRLSRAQTTTAGLAELVREKNRRTDELLASLESDNPEGATGELSLALTGQRRVLGDARALARELCANAESVLYARVDDRSLAALDFLDERLALQTGRSFEATPWRELGAAARDRAIAGSGLAGKLVDITALALQISEDLAVGATNDLSRAIEAVDIAKAHEHLTSASLQQKAMLIQIDKLLEKLAEWDNFQSVLSLTRDILNGQKSVSERTRQAAKDK